MKFSINDLVIFTEEILNGELPFFCAVSVFIMFFQFFKHLRRILKIN